MKLLQTIALVIVAIYFLGVIILMLLQSRLIFFPNRLEQDFKFKLRDTDREIFLQTADGERINALFFHGSGSEVILYLHGNAGNLAGWQFVADDFAHTGFDVLIIDYRGYGKSSGTISESGFYSDASSAYDWLINEGYEPDQIIIYGRSIGTGVAVETAKTKKCRGLVLESPYTSLKELADDKLPFFFPSLYLRFHFDNLGKINSVNVPVIFIHGTVDTLIPSSHSEILYTKFSGKKKLILITGGSHNDLNSFDEYSRFVAEELTTFF